MQGILRNAEHLEVEIFGPGNDRPRHSSLLRAKAEHPVADEAADAQRAPAGVTHRGSNPPRLLLQIHVNSI